MRILRQIATLCVPLVACAGQSRTTPAAPIRVLVVTATQDFRHGEAITASIERLRQAEASAGMHFDFTEDPAALTAQNLANYDVLFLDNSTLRIAVDRPADSVAIAAARWPRRGVAQPITRDQQQAIASFVRGGRGLVAIHSAVDALYGSADYREMVGGGLFHHHPYTREARVTVEDRSNAAVSHLGPSVLFREEYYYLDVDPRATSHVLMSLDLASVGDTTRTDHPVAFIRQYGKGRVFVNLLGHFAETWRRQDYLESVLQGIRIAAGRIPADFSVAAR